MLLKGSDDLTLSIVDKGITCFEELVAVVHDMPYVRTKTKTLAAPWLEERGTCSSKHAFLKYVAELNHLQEVELILCIFQFSPRTHPLVTDVFRQLPLDYIPEAHCYLSIKGKPVDVTFPGKSELLKEDLILEQNTVTAAYIIESKIVYHKAYIKAWLSARDIPITADEVWEGRERCIGALTGASL